MKIEGVRFHDERITFAASFDDGITVIIDKSLNYLNMLSVGPDTYYLRTRKWPTKKNIDKRVMLCKQWIVKNKNRYKKWPDHNKDHIIE